MGKFVLAVWILICALAYRYNCMAITFDPFWMKYEQHLRTVKDNNSLSLCIFLVDVLFFTSRKPVYSLKPSCWEWDILAFCFFCYIWRVYSKFPRQLGGNSYFLEAALNMYKDWGQVGFTDFDLFYMSKNFCCLSFFLSAPPPLSLSFSLSSVYPSSVLWSVQTTLTTLSSSLSPHIFFLWLLICPGTVPSGGY